MDTELIISILELTGIIIAILMNVFESYRIHEMTIHINSLVNNQENHQDNHQNITIGIGSD